MSFHCAPPSSDNDPDTVFVIPIDPEKGRIPPEGKLRVYRSKDGGGSWQAIVRDLPHVLSVSVQTLK